MLKQKELLKGYLGSIFPVLFANLVVFLVFFIVFLTLNLNMEYYFIALEISLFLLFIYFLVKFFFFKNYENQKDRIKTLENDIKSLNNKFLFEKSEMLEYFLMWVHQIKTPITSSKLIAESDKESEELRKIRKELIHIEDYTNMALNYLKITNSNSDMDIAYIKLDDIIKMELKKYSIFFISSNIKLEYKAILNEIITDGKWFSVVLEQILSNSVKYTKNGTIKISFNEKENYLEIKDSGIGIKDTDLPKIFERGYSGFNGRLNQKSTGIGLFLVKQISEKLGQKIEIDSKIGKGTTVKIYFPKDIDEITGSSKFDFYK